VDTPARRQKRAKTALWISTAFGNTAGMPAAGVVTPTARNRNRDRSGGRSSSTRARGDRPTANGNPTGRVEHRPQKFGHRRRPGYDSVGFRRRAGTRFGGSCNRAGRGVVHYYLRACGEWFVPIVLVGIASIAASLLENRFAA